MRILLAEDERKLASAIVAFLKDEKYDVDYVGDGSAALSSLETGVYDIAIMDVMMPEINGFEVVRSARNAGVKTPILILSAKSEVDDKITGLDSGADDYLAKPFQMRELHARLRALARRGTNIQDDSIHFADISLNVSTAMLSFLQQVRMYVLVKKN